MCPKASVLSYNLIKKVAATGESEQPPQVLVMQ